MKIVLGTLLIAAGEVAVFCLMIYAAALVLRWFQRKD